MTIFVLLKQIPFCVLNSNQNFSHAYIPYEYHFTFAISAEVCFLATTEFLIAVRIECIPSWIRREFSLIHSYTSLFFRFIFNFLLWTTKRLNEMLYTHTHGAKQTNKERKESISSDEMLDQVKAREKIVSIGKIIRSISECMRWQLLVWDGCLSFLFHINSKTECKKSESGSM